MRGKIILSGLILALSGAVVSAQSKPMVPSPGTVYCSGIVTTAHVPRSTYVITGEDSNSRIVYIDGNDVFFNKGSNDGVKAGDQFLVERAVQDPYNVQWTKWQNDILKKMGTMWVDEARLQVIVARPKVSIARVEHSCDYVQRGDVVLPFTERAAPPIEVPAHFDKFAPPNGKAMAMIIAGKNYVDAMGNQSIAYVNLGNAQGVQVGDYFTIFRYQGTQHETIYQEPRFAFDQDFHMDVKDLHMMGFGSVPEKWNWSNVPRQDIGQALVLRTAPNSSTVLITYSVQAIFAGDYVELE